MKLVIGNKNYSSWSLRPWLLLSAFDIEFEEVQESLLHEGIKARLGKYSPTSLVPVLVDGSLTIWDSLAICEYISEAYLDGRGWPGAREKRARARALCSEMHSGFSALRNELPMNCRAVRTVEMSADAGHDVARIESIWSECTAENRADGPWLFGDFSIADCFFAPVVLRFKTYGISLSGPASNYAQQLVQHEKVMAWVDSAKTETELIAEDEAGVDGAT